MEENVKDRLLLFLKNKRINNSEFGRMFDVSTAYVSSIRKSISPEMLDKLRSRFPELSIEWLLTGDGQMLNNTIQRKSDSDELYYTYLLPMSAVAGTLTEFEGSATLADCEKIVSPIAGVDFAINIYGDSMMPEYPSGSMVLIKRMNIDTFIAWGEVFLLDTVNGILLKELQPSEKDDEVVCVSHNPSGKYRPFNVPKKDIRSIFRVLACITRKQ